MPASKIPANFAEIAHLSNKELVALLGCNQGTITRARKLHGIVKVADHGPRPIPEGFAERAGTISDAKLAKEFGVWPHTVLAWRRRLGISAWVRPRVWVKKSTPKPRKGRAAPLKPVPPDFAEQAAKLCVTQLVTHYGVARQTVRRWLRVLGVEPVRVRRPKGQGLKSRPKVLAQPATKASPTAAPAPRSKLPGQISVGDVLPLAGPVDLGKLHAARCRRGQLQAAAASGRTNQQTNQANLILGQKQDRDARAADPVEQAKTHLRRRGLNVYNGEVQGYRKGTFVVGTRLLTKVELLERAERAGWSMAA